MRRFWAEINGNAARLRRGMKRLDWFEWTVILLGIVLLTVLLRMSDSEPAMPKCREKTQTTRCG